MASKMGPTSSGLIQKVGVEGGLAASSTSEEAWIEVIQKMDEVYADLVHYQVELEEKNSALEEAQRFIDSVQAAMTDVLIVCDVQGRIEQVNPALEQLVGKEASSLLQRPLKELFDEASVLLVEDFPEKVRSDMVYECEVSLIGADGSAAPLAMNCSSRFDHDGRLVGMVFIGRPVGELRRAYEELQQAQQQLVHSEKMASLGRLVAGVAHELNNPISFVFGNMHALKGYGDRITRYLDSVHGNCDVSEREQLRKELKIDRILGDIGSLIDGTLEGAERVSEIVQDLRRFSGNQKEGRHSIELQPLVATAVDWVVKAGRRKPEVVFKLAPGLVVHGVKGSIHQVVVNLVQNALDVMEHQDQLKIELKSWQQEDKVMLSVRDYGSGIPHKDLLRIFDPFFTTKDVGRGTGLGLYISYGLANDQGGDLQAVNHPNGGAVFTLTLKSA